jgi:DNA-binding MarR family transcriptional regulator
MATATTSKEKKPATDPARATRRLILIIEEFRKLDPEMQAQTMMTLLLVAAKPGIQMKEMQERLGIARSTMSRNVAILSSHGYRAGYPGYALIEAREDPTDRKSKQVFLTAKGKRFLESIQSYLGG